MARILYGVQADAGGHLARSRTIAQSLRGHEILFVGGELINSLRRFGFDTMTVPMPGTVIRGNRLDLPATLSETARALWDQSRVVERLVAVIRDFSPDLIVSDFEYFVPLAARRAGLPCVSVDRQHFITNCSYRAPPGGFVGKALFEIGLRALRMTASRYFVVSFVEAASRGRWETEVFPPVVRPEILGMAPRTGDHALVYLRSETADWVRRTLGGRRRRYVIYGHDHEAEEGNLLFRRHDPDRFADDLAGACYAVSHAGHNMIGECLHLGKPLLCFPGAGLYEQYLNAHMLEDAGFGVRGEKRHALQAFNAIEGRLDALGARLAEWRPWSTRSVAGRLGQLLDGAVADKF